MNKKERPILSELVNAGTSDIEKFQNEAIRPIIKMQHNLLIILFQNYLKHRKINFNNLKKEKQKERINIILTKDTNFKNILLGIVIGHFSKNELMFYTKNTSELKRRIIQIVNQRSQDSLLDLSL
ncbi:MAG: glyoxalase [Flavobacteriales bacterium]|jgi:hypothetical protein|tara:strand:- start:155 stop:529 length:375 start_codon:yes stop_codon:yes gene_type:complete